MGETKDRSDRASGPRRRGFTLVEMAIVVVILGVLAALAVPNFSRMRERAMVARAIGDLRAIGLDLTDYRLDHGNALPASLAEVGRDGLLDPWGNPYRYLVVTGANRGALRKDRFLVPINSDFDLYSMGPDGQSTPPLTAAASRDDIIRANDGGYVGVAEGY